jgi:WD40 repeat protein
VAENQACRRLLHTSARSMLEFYAYVAYSGDGRALVTGSADATDVWDPSTGRRCFPTLRHAGNTFAPAISHNSRWLARGGDTGEFSVWDLGSGKVASGPTKHPSWVMRIAFSPDDRYLAVGERDGTARVWDWRVGRLAGPPMRTDEELFGIDFTPNQRGLFTLTRSGRLRAWEWRSGKPVSPVTSVDPSPVGYFWSARAAADGRSLVVGSPHAAAIYQLDDFFGTDPNDAELLATRAELKSGQRIHDGAIINLDSGEWFERWTRSRSTAAR